MSRLDVTQIEHLKEISAYLKQLRQEQAISLEEISTRTYIPMRVLRAIEGLEIDQLPEPVFVKGFIRRYADALGVDGIALSQEFPISSQSPAVEEHATEMAPEVPLPQRPRKEGKFPTKVAALIVGAVAIVGGIAYAASQVRVVQPRVTSEPQALPSEPSQSPPAPSVSVPPAPTVQKPPTSPNPVASPTPTPASTASSGSPLEITVSLAEPSWMQVTIDGQSAFEGVLEKGTQRTWKAKERLVVTAGNAGGVRVALNKGEAKLMGQPGEVREVTFTPTSVPAVTAN